MRAILALALALTLTALGTTVGAESSPVFRVIVHPDNPIASIDRKFLTDAFLKKITRWGNDEAIRPVDLETDSPVRRKFSEEVLRRSVGAVKSYWQQAIFSGRNVPPPELDTDEDVVKYVLKHPGAVGYVSASAAIDRAKVLVVK